MISNHWFQIIIIMQNLILNKIKSSFKRSVSIFCLEKKYFKIKNMLTIKVFKITESFSHWLKIQQKLVIWLCKHLFSMRRQCLMKTCSVECSGDRQVGRRASRLWWSKSSHYSHQWRAGHHMLLYWQTDKAAYCPCYRSVFSTCHTTCRPRKAFDRMRHVRRSAAAYQLPTAH